MQPIHELLSRIRWDPALAGHRFALAYEDHTAREDVVVRFEDLRFDRATPGLLTVIDEDGGLRSIPLHRVRVVYQDDEIIWTRRHRPEV